MAQATFTSTDTLNVLIQSINTAIAGKTSPADVQAAITSAVQNFYTKPVGGITETDLSAAIQSILKKASLPIAPVDLQDGQPGYRGTAYPNFVKSANNPFMTIQNQTLGSLQWPCVLYVGDIFGTAANPQPGPFGEWYRCYTSTDHANAVGSGIGLLTCNSLTPEDGTAWVDRGFVFHDITGAGEFQTETAKVMYVPDAIINGVVTPCFYMYYHRLLGADGTAGEVNKMAYMTVAQAVTSETWTIHPDNNGEVSDTQHDGANAWPNPALFGYFRPFRFGQDFYAHTLISGVPQTAFGLARSKTGLPGSWLLDGRPMYSQAQLLDDPQGRFNASSHQVAWNSGQVMRWRGQLVWIGNVMANSSGAGTPSYTFPCIAPISHDFRRLTASPTPLFTSNQAWEPNYGVPGMLDGRGAGSVVIGPDGKVRFFYQGIGGIHPTTNPATAKAAAGAFGIAVAS